MSFGDVVVLDDDDKCTFNHITASIEAKEAR
jgi:hypothetical protein